MWVINIQESSNEFRRVFWLENDIEGQRLIDDGKCARCTGPDGVTFNEAEPEDVMDSMIKEDKLWKTRKKKFI